VSFCARLCRTTVPATFWLCALGWGATAHAFSAPESYPQDVEEGGGGGRWFTGSPADGYGCGVCHTGAEGAPLYVTGLPQAGYVPGTTYPLTISWPQWAQTENAIVAANPKLFPVMELVTELVAESGQGSGTLAIGQYLQESAAEKCSRPAVAKAAYLWTITPNQDAPNDILPTCTADDVNERCIATVKGCGAQELKMTWTAPDQWQGNIWFSAGFVTTNDSTSIPNDKDGVTMLSIPLAPAASTSAGYLNRLESGCSVTPLGTAHAFGWLLAPIGLWTLRRAQRRRRREERS
jgi:hypothetical protein